MPVTIGCVLINYQNGGLQPGGGYDFAPLIAAFADSPRQPDLIFYCEAKHYADRGGTGLLLAAQAISDKFGVPYIGLLGYMERAPLPPAFFYNPNVLTLLPPWYGHGSHHDYQDQRNVAHFAVRGAAAPGEPDVEFMAGVEHWEPLFGASRELAARRWGRYGRKANLPGIFAADTNCTPSGPHFPQRDWALAAELDWTNASHKGREEDGKWGAPDASVGWFRRVVVAHAVVLPRFWLVEGQNCGGGRTACVRQGYGLGCSASRTRWLSVSSSTRTTV